MPSLGIFSLLHSFVMFEIVDPGQYSVFKIYCRKLSDQNAEMKLVYYDPNNPYVAFENLEPNTTYVYNMQYGTTEDNCTNYWYSSNAPSFTTGVLMLLNIDSNIERINITCIRPNGYQDTIDCYGDLSPYGLSVKANSNCYINSIDSNGKYPIIAKGQTEFTIMNDDGSWVDRYLSVGSERKEFTIYVGGASSGSGLVWINGNWYQPYIYQNNGWHKAVPYIYYNKEWKGVGR